MKSERSIRLHYQDTIRKAERLEELASELLKLAERELADVETETSGLWRGSACDRYHQKHNQMADKAKKHARQLREAARALRDSALRLYKVEMMALSIFNRKH